MMAFVWRSARWWALLFAMLFIARTMLDWLVPTADFHNRAALTTYAAFAILFAAGFLAVRRSGAFVAGPLVSTATAAIAAPINIVGSLVLVAIWHDPDTLAAIGGSGGLVEDLTLPILVIVPAIAVGVIAGLVGVSLARGRGAVVKA